jgi:anti-sigma factor RsiW
MNCHEAGRALSLFADGRLRAKEIGTLEEHLGTCAGCSRFARTVEAVKAHFAELACPPPPPDLLERVLVRLREPGARLLTLLPMLRRTAAAAAVLFAVTGSAALWVGLCDTGEPQPPPVRLTADGALDWIMSEIARENAPRIAVEEKR